jgi:hypothetical protein
MQSEGELASESHSLLILVEQKFENPRFVDSYRHYDEIQSRTGSPTTEGIPHNSMVRVLEIDARKNTLTIETACYS